MFWEITSYLYAYYGDYARQSARDFQYGHKQAFATFETEGKDRDTIYMTDAYGQAYLYALLYRRIKPQDFLAGALANVKIGRIYWPDLETDTFYIATPQEISPDDPAVIQLIKVPDSQEVMFVIAEKD